MKMAEFMGMRFVVMPGMSQTIGRIVQITADADIRGVLIVRVDPSWTKAHPALATEMLNKALADFQARPDRRV
jgi:hypothetical protein